MMYRILRISAKMLLITLVMLFFAGIQPAFATEPINVGFTTDFSSGAANIGISQAKIVEMVIKNLNAAGGIKGRPIHLIIQDNGSDPSKAIGNVKMFKDQYKTKIMIVDVTSSVVMALKGWADANKIPMVTASPQTDKITVLNQKAWVFRTCAPASLNIQAILARVKQLGYKKVAFEGTTLAWGTDTLGTIKENAKEYGIELVNVTLVEPKTKDLSIQARKMKTSGAEAVICCEYEAETAALSRAFAAIDWKPYVIHTSAANVNSTLPLVDPTLLETWEAVTIADPSKPLVKKIWKDAKAFAKGVRIDEDEKALRAYDSVGVMIEALKASKNVDDAEANRDAFYNIDKNYERATGKKGSKGGFTTAQNHLLTVKDVNVFVVHQGKFGPAK